MPAGAAGWRIWDFFTGCHCLRPAHIHRYPPNRQAAWITLLNPMERHAPELRTYQPGWVSGRPAKSRLGIRNGFRMSTLGFFSMSLLVLLINTLTQRRLIGYFIVEILLISSLPLASIFLNLPPFFQYVPIIRNLVMRFYPFVLRNLDQTYTSIYTWLIWLIVLLPLTWLAYRKQDYLSHPDAD